MILLNALVLEPTDTLLLFTDAASSPKTGIAVGAFLYLTPQELEAHEELIPTDLSKQLANRTTYKQYESKKSTWSEIQTIIDALYLTQKNCPSIKKIEIYTDCQTLCDLMQERKVKLEKNNFVTRTGKIHNNADHYKELFAITGKFQIKVFKIKGHASTANRTTIQEKIFAIVDKASRKKLRSIPIDKQVDRQLPPQPPYWTEHLNRLKITKLKR